MILEDGLAMAVLTGAVAGLLTLVAVRAFRRTGNAGFLALVMALTVIPTFSGVVDGPLVKWLNEGLVGESRGTVLSGYLLVTRSLSALLISAALLMLARPGSISRRRRR